MLRTLGLSALLASGPTLALAQAKTLESGQVSGGIILLYAGLLFAARVGAVRGDVGQGFDLDIVMVLLGGVSIFGGSGTPTGVGLAILIVLSLRNGMALLNVTGHVQTGVVGLLLIASVLVPRLGARLSGRTVA